MTALLQFGFILLVPLVVVAAVLVGLFAIGALFDLLDNPGQTRARIEGLFQRPPAPPRAPGKKHFYRAHWQY